MSTSMVTSNNGRFEKWTPVVQYAELQGDKLSLYNEKPERHNRISCVSFITSYN